MRGIKGYYEAALKIATSQERIPYGSIRKGHVYNFWQDETHERGLWRRTTLAEYASAAPGVGDAARRRCAGEGGGGELGLQGRVVPAAGADALPAVAVGWRQGCGARARVFDRGGRREGGFVAGGFDIPEAKSSIEWQDKDTLLIATDWGGDGPR